MLMLTPTWYVLTSAELHNISCHSLRNYVPSELSNSLSAIIYLHKHRKWYNYHRPYAYSVNTRWNTSVCHNSTFRCHSVFITLNIQLTKNTRFAKKQAENAPIRRPIRFDMRKVSKSFRFAKHLIVRN